MRLRRIYILPTRFGAVFLAGALIMIMIGASYQNNLVNLLAYFMLSLVFISMIQTHNNLKDVRVETIESEGGFQGSEFVLTTTLVNDSKEPRHGLEVNYRKLKTKTKYANELPLVSRGVLKLRSSHFASKRGHHPLRSVRVSTVYPLGLFRAWFWDEVDSSYFVYPDPVGTRALPVALGDEGEEPSPGALAAGDDFYGHRRYHDGDSFRHVDWKALARGRPMLIKEFSGAAAGQIKLRYALLDGLETEARLSQLARWVEDARLQKLSFSLEVAGQIVPLSYGVQHATRCLELLASFEDPS